MENLTGRQFDAYRLTELLQERGTGSYYRAYQANLDRSVTVWVFPRRMERAGRFRDRFIREALKLARLQHAHILPVIDYGRSEGHAYLVMPLVWNSTLEERMREGRFPLAQTVRIVSQVGSALDYAHNQGFVHLDVKPSNIVLDKQGNCLLTDFGEFGIDEVFGNIPGNPTYMSPEQGTGNKIDHRSDIYSLGVVLYELATGQPPYHQTDTPIAVLFKKINDPFPPPRQVQPEIPERMERVILKALAVEPEDRFPTAAEMVQALSKVAVSVTPDAGPVQQQLAPTGVPSKILSRLNAVLLNCGPFATQKELRTLFVDDRLYLWQAGLPETNNPAARVEATIEYLHSRYNDAGENGLVLLLRVLTERTNPADDCYDQLETLSKALAE